MSVIAFQQRVLDWFDRHGRKELPWQGGRSPYAIWVSEIMLQQTQVATVIPYYLRFMERFPDVATLADAPLDEVIAHWAGLGYYARARHLHQAARQLQTEHAGRFPTDLDRLQQLPGVGRSTAGAILSLGLGERATILDGNVRRVLSRHAGIEGWPGATAVSRRLWALGESLTPTDRVAEYNQAMMDLGALICRRGQPACERCPLAEDCVARRADSVASIPGVKPKRAMPVRACYFLLLKNPAQQVFLETRPPVGIWGGLQCLPEFGAWEELEVWCQQRRIATDAFTRLPPRRHTFSHYHLDFTPVLGQTTDFSAVHDASPAGWFHTSEAGGLPAPIKTLLTETHGQR